MAIQKPAQTAFGKIAVLISQDANVAGNGLELVKSQVVDAALAMSDSGGGELVIVKAAGDEAEQVATADLRIADADNQLEHDEQTRTRIAGERIGDAFAAADATPATGQGRNLMSLLAMAERVAPAPGQPYQIFVVGFGLGTVDPADARRQMGLDPTQAVALMAERLPTAGPIGDHQPGVPGRGRPAAGTQPADLGVAQGLLDGDRRGNRRSPGRRGREEHQGPRFGRRPGRARHRQHPRPDEGAGGHAEANPNAGARSPGPSHSRNPRRRR